MEYLRAYREEYAQKEAQKEARRVETQLQARTQVLNELTKAVHHLRKSYLEQHQHQQQQQQHHQHQLASVRAAKVLHRTVQAAQCPQAKWLALCVERILRFGRKKTTFTRSLLCVWELLLELRRTSLSAVGAITPKMRQLQSPRPRVASDDEAASAESTSESEEEASLRRRKRVRLERLRGELLRLVNDVDAAIELCNCAKVNTSDGRLRVFLRIALQRRSLSAHLRLLLPPTGQTQGPDGQTQGPDGQTQGPDGHGHGHGHGQEQTEYMAAWQVCARWYESHGVLRHEASLRQLAAALDALFGPATRPDLALDFGLGDAASCINAEIALRLRERHGANKAVSLSESAEALAAQFTEELLQEATIVSAVDVLQCGNLDALQWFEHEGSADEVPPLALAGDDLRRRAVAAAAAPLRATVSHRRVVKKKKTTSPVLSRSALVARRRTSSSSRRRPIASVGRQVVVGKIEDLYCRQNESVEQKEPIEETETLSVTTPSVTPPPSETPSETSSVATPSVATPSVATVATVATPSVSPSVSPSIDMESLLHQMQYGDDEATQEPKHLEPKQPEPDQPEPEQSEPEQPEPEQPEPEQLEPEQPEPEQPEPELSDSELPEPKLSDPKPEPSEPDEPEPKLSEPVPEPEPEKPEIEPEQEPEPDSEPEEDIPDIDDIDTQLETLTCSEHRLSDRDHVGDHPSDHVTSDHVGDHVTTEYSEDLQPVDSDSDSDYVFMSTADDLAVRADDVVRADAVSSGSAARPVDDRYANTLAWSLTPVARPPTGVLFQEQDGKCAGCGRSLSRRRRRLFGNTGFCRFTGRLYCTEGDSPCMSDAKALIPSRVATLLDAKPHKVCNDAKVFLDQMYAIPLIALSEVSARSGTLQRLRPLSAQLRQMTPFVTQCARTDELHALLGRRGMDLLDQHRHKQAQFSLSDLLQRQRTLQECQQVLQLVRQHIAACATCTARAHICEWCDDARPLFPWQSSVVACRRCNALSHRQCAAPSGRALLACRRCERLQKRQHAPSESE